MSWRRLAGVGAVVLVLGLVVGAGANFLVDNDLLTSSAQQTPALATFAVVVLAFAVGVFLASPSQDWTDNPYW